KRRKIFRGVEAMPEKVPFPDKGNKPGGKNCRVAQINSAAMGFGDCFVDGTGQEKKEHADDDRHQQGVFFDVHGCSHIFAVFSQVYTALLDNHSQFVHIPACLAHKSAIRYHSSTASISFISRQGAAEWPSTPST